MNKSGVSAGWHAQTARGRCTHLPLPCKQTLVRIATLAGSEALDRCCASNLRPLPLRHPSLHRVPQGVPHLPHTPLLTGLPLQMRRLCLPVSHLAMFLLGRQTVAVKALQAPLKDPRAGVPVPLTPKHLLQCGCAQKTSGHALRQRAHATKARKKQRTRQRLNMFRRRALGK